MKIRFHSARPWGNISYGLNLDGRIDPDDQVTPDGVKGIDNNLYRVIGCIEEFRGPTGILHFLVNRYLRDFEFNRVLIEISGVEDMVNDPHVDVTILRGRDRMMADATGNDIIPGGSNRVDMRWGRKYVQRLTGKIVDGVLTTEPKDVTLPHAIFNQIPGEDYMKGRSISIEADARTRRRPARGLFRYRYLVPSAQSFLVHASPELRAALVAIDLQAHAPLGRWVP